MLTETELESLKQRVELLESQVEVQRRKTSGELERMSTRLQESHERWEGQKVRIDRILGTCDDLLKRFEAWKTVGNEMGQDVITLQEDSASMMTLLNTHTRMFDNAVERMDEHDERLERHRQMLAHMTELANTLKEFMHDIQRILDIRPGGSGERGDALHGDDLDPGSGDRSPAVRSGEQRSGEERERER
jgi:hypothetical protein